MRVTLAGVGRSHGAHTVLRDVTISIDSGARLGVVAPNGVGKSTLLRLIAGLERPDAGAVSRVPADAAVGYLPQEPDAREGETLLAYLGRRTGVAPAERARAALAAILLARFDLFLLDEPTNDLDLDGLARLERWVGELQGALVVVSHDRAFLDRSVTRVAEIDPHSHRVREWAGGWTAYAEAREAERRRAWAAFEAADAQRRAAKRLLAQRHTEARAHGASLGDKTGGRDRRATHALTAKVRQAERMIERVPAAEKPVEPWELRLTLRAGERLGDLVLALHGAVARRGGFQLGPLDLDVRPGERLLVRGPNGSGKSTLLDLVTGRLPPAAGRRVVGRRTVIGTLEQAREGGESSLGEAFPARTGLLPEEARTLLAKFGLGAEHVLRPERSLSPGERTRARIAELQARGVNLLVLDEPTNHLDLEAIEQLEAALAGYDGAAVIVSHDRRFVENIAPTRELTLG